jgi:hypothetical protein
MGSSGGGGGGDGVKYDNLEKLYEEQTANAKMLRELSQKYLPGAMESYMGQVGAVQNPNYATQQANVAAADMAKANAMERDAVTRQLNSSGVNASDPRYAGSLRNTSLNNAARMAAGVNSTRDSAQRYQLAVAQDALGTMTGTNNSAASQMGSATSGLSSLYSNQQQLAAQQDANRSQNVSNAVGGAYAMLMKDGGKVRGLKLLANGGLTGGAPFAPITPPVAQQAPAPQQPGASPATAVQVGKLGNSILDKGFSGIVDKMQTRGQNLMNNFGKVADFIGADGQAQAIYNYADKMAPQAAEKVGAAAAEGAASAAAMEGIAGAGAGASAAGTAAATAEGASALTGALGAASTAIPWIGAAAALGQAFGLFNEGGKVSDLREKGGDVPGQWRENKDTVPALLVPEEYVVNAEAAALAGHDRLEALNRKGMQLRRQGKEPARIKSAGLEALK